MAGSSPAGHEMVAFGDIWRVNYKGKTDTFNCIHVELILSLKSQTVKSVKSLVSVSNSYYHYLLAEWIHRVGENTLDIRVGTMRTVTACYRLVACRILPRQAPVARHFKVVVPAGFPPEKNLWGGYGGGGGGHKFAKKGDLSSEHFLEGLH